MIKIMKIKALIICLLLVTSQSFADGDWFPTNRPNCVLWNGAPMSDESVEWSGACESGKAHGKGWRKWRFLVDGKVVFRLIEGEMEYGYPVGKTSIMYENKSMYIGELNREGNRHGSGTYIFPDGKKLIGQWENGEYIDNKLKKMNNYSITSKSPSITVE